MKLTIIYFVLIFSCVITHAQNNYSSDIKEIKLDFATMKLDYQSVKCDLPEGSLYRFVVENINLNLYKVNVNHIDTSYSKDLNAPSFNSLLSGLPDLVQSVKSSDVESSLEKLNSDLFLSLTAMNGFAKTDKTDNIEKIEVLEQLSNIEANLLKLVILISKNEKSLNNLKIGIHLTRLYETGINVNSPKVTIDKVLELLQNYVTELANLKVALIEQGIQLASIIKQYANIVSSDEDAKNHLKKINTSYNTIIEHIDKTLSQYDPQQINTLLENVVYMIGKRNTVYKSAPFQLNGEQVKFKYTIEPREDKYNLQAYSSEIVFPEKTKTIFTIGMAFYGANLANEAYTIQVETTIDSTNTFQLIDEDLSKIEMGMAALIRGGKRNESGKSLHPILIWPRGFNNK